jgi:rare lipoprotein A (peptidoglycan hydrolase)
MKKIVCGITLLLLAACSGGASGPSAEPPLFTGVKIGKPYSVAGKWYVPKKEDDYDKTGMASWYGPGFHGKMTANGEIYNQHDITAAHPTLPMPSFVRVTNLENGRQAIVRINDRGPFHSNRIIDLSKASAEKLGVTGLARVRVQYLPEETETYIASRGKVLPQENPTAYASAVMPRETMEMPPENDAKYYPVEVKELKRDDFIPAPIQIANNAGVVVDSAPILSVNTKDTLSNVLVKDAQAEPAPYTSALEKEKFASQQPFKMVGVAASSSQYDLEKAEASSSTQQRKGRVMKAGKLGMPERKATSSLPAKVALTAWSVRVASFSQRENAEKLTQQLLTLGQPELQPVLIDGTEWYRVYLHPLAGAEQQTLIAELQKIGLHDAQVIN